MHEPPEDSPKDRPRRPRGQGATNAGRARDGQADDPRERDPRAGNPRAGNPRADGSRPGTPRSSDPRAGAPRQNDPRGGAPRRSDPQGGGERPYNVYRAAPRSLVAQLRGETDIDVDKRAQELARERAVRDGERGAGGGRGGSGGRDGSGGAGGDGPLGPKRRFFRRRAGVPRRPPFHPIRILKYVVTFAVFWVLLSIVLFFISASGDAGDLPGGNTTNAALSSSGPILFSANNILILGLDNRPKTGYSSKEGGLSASNFDEADANTDSIMIWRLGGGVSRRLSIPRDTLMYIPSCGGQEKINAAWSCGGPKATIQAVETFTGIKINHLIVVDLGNFTKFINDVGGVNVKTPRICSTISGGAADGGYTLDLSPGVHHLNGNQALTLARTRENSCNAAYDDYQRQAMQQQILNSVKSQLFTVHTFIHLPWASWDAPRVVQTDMGPLSLMQMFAASELGGSAPAETLKQHGGYYNGEDVQLPNPANVRSQVNKLMTGQ